jgi:hypothetical protein
MFRFLTTNFLLILFFLVIGIAIERKGKPIPRETTMLVLAFSNFLCYWYIFPLEDRVHKLEGLLKHPDDKQKDADKPPEPFGSDKI